MKIGPIRFYFTVIVTMGFGILPLAWWYSLLLVILHPRLTTLINFYFCHASVKKIKRVTALISFIFFICSLVF
jgi:hypothetical protein